MIRSLQKPYEMRRARDLQNLADVFKFTRFFKQLKLKNFQMQDIVQHMDYKEMEANNYLIKYGALADEFYVML